MALAEANIRLFFQPVPEALLQEGPAHGTHRDAGAEPGQAPGWRIRAGVPRLVKGGAPGGGELRVEAGEVTFEDLPSPGHQTVQVPALGDALPAGGVVRKGVTLEDRYPAKMPGEHASGEQAADARADDDGVPSIEIAGVLWRRLVSHTGYIQSAGTTVSSEAAHMTVRTGGEDRTAA